MDLAVDQIDLVIFDCDGVLVESERLAVRTEAKILAHLGWPLSEADVVDRFVGRSAHYMHREIERHLGREIDWDAEFEAAYRDVFEKELVPVEGVMEVLDSLSIHVCRAQWEPCKNGVHSGSHGTL